MSDQPIVIVHLDESCRGNGQEISPGGAGALVEVQGARGIERRDFAHHDPNTTNNRMALEGATMVLRLLGARGRRCRVVAVSDSEYLVKGMREWVPGWRARGWRRKAGPIENLERWQALVEAAATHDVQWTWVRGHRGHPKNEYADHLAVQAATQATATDGLAESGFLEWLADRQAKGRDAQYDPDAAFRELAALVRGGDPLPLALNL